MADASLGKAVLHTSLDTSGLTTGLTKVERDTRTSVQRISTDLAGIGKNLQGIGTRLSIGLTAPLTALGVAGIKSAMQLETFSESLKVLIGDADRATAAFDDLYQFSARAPFSWESLTEGTRVLAAFGTEAEDLVPTLSMLGDVAAGVQTPIEDLAEAYGRMQLTGRVGTLELQRLASRGIPIYTELARILNVSEGSVQDLVTAGAIGFPQIEAAFQSMTSEGGKFSGMMAAQADTVAGRLNTLKDSFSQITDIIGERLIPAFDKIIAVSQAAVDWFVNLDESTQGLFVGLGVALTASGPLLLGFGTLLVQLPKLVAGFQALQGVMGGFLGPAGLVIGLTVVLGTLAERFVTTDKALETHKDWIDEVAGAYAEYRGEIHVTTEAERAAAIERLNVTRAEMQERLQLLNELAESQRSSVQGFLDSPIGRFLMPGFLSVQGGASQNTLREAERVQDIIGRIGRDVEALQSGATTLVERTTAGAATAARAASGVTTALTGTREAAAAAARTVEDVFAGISERGRDAERIAAAYGNTIEARTDSIMTRMSALQRGLTELVTDFGLDPLDDRVQYIVARLQELQAELDTLHATVTTIPLTITPSGGVVGERPLTPPAVTASVDMSGLRSPAMVREELRLAQAAKDAAGTLGELVQASADVDRLTRELARLTSGVQLSVEAFARVPEAVAITAPAFTARVPEAVTIAAPAVTASVPGARPLGITPVAEVDSAGLRSIAAIEAELQAARAELRTTGTEAGRLTAKALVDELQAELDEAIRRITPIQVEVAPSAFVGAPVQLGVTPSAQIDGMDPSEWKGAQDEAARTQTLASEQFRDTVISAGISFTDTLVRGIQSGDAGSIVSGAFGAGGSILGAIPGISIVGTIIAGLLPIFGGLVGGLFGGGRSQAELEATRAAGVTPRGASAIDLRVIINQSLNIQSLTDTSSRRAVNGLLEDTVRKLEDTITRNIIPRIAGLEAASG